MPRTIYLEFDEEIISVLQKIKKAGADDLVLVVPRGARVLRNLTGLKLLRDQAQRMHKTVSIATADERGQVLAARSGLALVSDSKQVLARPNSSAAQPRRRMGDIAPRTKLEKPRLMVQANPPRQKQKPEELSKLLSPPAGSGEIRLPQPVKIRRLSLWYILVPGLLALVACAGAVLFVLPTAVVTVTPRSEPITRDLDILVDSQAGTEPDVTNETIAGEKVTEELSDSKSYTPTGAKNIGEKASGFVTLYNFSSSTLILKRTTTRLEANGKTYFFLQDVGSIRPTGRIGPDLEVDPDSLIDPVAIVAADGGDGSNLPAGTRFEIYNEVFGHQSEALYAVNANPIAGGTNREIKVVSPDDLANARTALSNDMVDRLRNDLRQRLSADSQVTEKAFAVEVLEEKFSHPAGTETETFQLSLKVRINALVYKESDVMALVKSRITRLLPDNKHLVTDSDQQLLTEFISLDLGAGSGTLHTHFESKIKYSINTDFLSRSLPGKTQAEVKEILLARPEIEDVKVEFSPFWVKTVPWLKSKLIFKVAE